MTWDGTGTFNPPPGPEFPAVSDDLIRAAYWNTVIEALCTGFSNCVTRNGEATITGNQPMGTKKLTGMGVGNANTDSITLGQAQDQGYLWGGTAGGTANALTIAINPAVTAFAAGQSFIFKASSTANTAAATITTNSLTPIAVQVGGVALVAGDIQANEFYRVTLDTTSTGQLTPLTGQRRNRKGAAITSAATLNLDTSTGTYAHVTGTVTITAVTLTGGRIFDVIFDGALVLTNGAALLLPGAANITTAANDRARFVDDGSGNVVCFDYVRASGRPIIPSLVPSLEPVGVGAGGGTSLVAADHGTFVDLGLVADTTVAIAAIASLGGAGWWVDIHNGSSFTLTLDPNGSEFFYVENVARLTIKVYPGECFRIMAVSTDHFSCFGRKTRVKLQATQTAAAVANINCENGFTDAEITRVEVQFNDVLLAGTGTLSLRLKKSGSYVTGASYAHNGTIQGTTTVLAATGATAGKLTVATSTSSQEISGIVTILKPADATATSLIMADTSVVETSGPKHNRDSMGISETTAAAIQGVQFIEAGGANITSGTFDYWGIRA